jgi:hypothetical protein
MRYINLLIILTLLVGCQAQTPPQPTPSMPAGSPWVHVEPATSKLKVGQSIPLSVAIDNAQDLSGVELFLGYDPAVIEIQDEDTATPGTQLKIDGLLAADFVAFNQVEEGLAGVAFLQLPPRQPATGTGQLISLAATGLEAGTTAITLSVKLADSTGNPISASVTHGQLTVTQ